MSVEEVKVKSLTREDKDRLVEEARNSGQTQKERCTSRGIRLRTLRSWICTKNRREKKAGRSAVPVAWFEVNERADTRAIRPCTAMEVCIGLCVVRVSFGFDRALFADVCRTLSELC